MNYEINRSWWLCISTNSKNILQIRSIWEDSLYPPIPKGGILHSSRPKSLSISQGASPMSMTMGLAFKGNGCPCYWWKWHDDKQGTPMLHSRQIKYKWHLFSKGSRFCLATHNIHLRWSPTSSPIVLLHKPSALKKQRNKDKSTNTSCSLFSANDRTVSYQSKISPTPPASFACSWQHQGCWAPYLGSVSCGQWVQWIMIAWSRAGNGVVHVYIYTPYIHISLNLIYYIY